MTDEQLKAKFNIEHTNELTSKHASAIIEELKRMYEKDLEVLNYNEVLNNPLSYHLDKRKVEGWSEDDFIGLMRFFDKKP